MGLLCNLRFPFSSHDWATTLWVDKGLDITLSPMQCMTRSMWLVLLNLYHAIQSSRHCKCTVVRSTPKLVDLNSIFCICRLFQKYAWVHTFSLNKEEVCINSSNAAKQFYTIDVAYPFPCATTYLWCAYYFRCKLFKKRRIKKTFCKLCQWFRGTICRSWCTCRGTSCILGLAPCHPPQL